MQVYHTRLYQDIDVKIRLKAVFILFFNFYAYFLLFFRIIVIKVLTMVLYYSTICIVKLHRGVEQLAARRAHNPKVGSSSLPPATNSSICQ